SRKIDNLD
nr:Chain D, LEDGF peptide [Homo sapiens]3AVM_F Chain F, LEDGF peptide [Homo sapiens]